MTITEFRKWLRGRVGDAHRAAKLADKMDKIECARGGTSDYYDESHRQWERYDTLKSCYAVALDVDGKKKRK